MQEYHGHKDQEKNYLREWGNDGVFNFYTSESRGVAILFNRNIEFEIHNCIRNDNGNMIILDLTIETLRLTLVNVYGPNFDSPGFYDNLVQHVSTFDNASLILCGAWNLVMDYDHDTFNYNKRNNPHARDKVLSIIDNYDLFDIWRINNPSKRNYTWKSSYAPKKMGRLDFFLVTDDIQNIASSSNILSGYRTDHSMISIILVLNEQKRGKGFWKFNTSLLFDTEYKSIITNLINEEVDRYNMNVSPVISDQLFFDTLKMSIRGRTIAYASKKHKKSKENEFLLSESIDKFEDMLSRMIVAMV